MAYKTPEALGTRNGYAGGGESFSRDLIARNVAPIQADRARKLLDMALSFMDED